MIYILCILILEKVRGNFGKEKKKEWGWIYVWERMFLLLCKDGENIELNI